MAGVRRLIPLLDRVLVERVKAEAAIGGVFVPESAQGKLNEAVVVAVGPGARDANGAVIPMSVKEGDKVLLPDYRGTEVKLGDKEYVLFEDRDLLGKLEDK
eukprot:TRINITY_DN46602_c0_g1_i1.p2 TRINITY_DN46602_c0_g1~~TRINITY_DN46602_c0_g1_i1.p2  ORF type:complete len:101 (-),score=27.03 TRINITY_DN46602_c0_g1_i1:21-323(-)